MKTINAAQFAILNHISEYDRLNNVLNLFRTQDIDSVLAEKLVQLDQDIEKYGDYDIRLVITSKGRIEYNIYRNKDRKPEKKERKGCPRCGDKDDSCQICCGYHITKEGKS